MNQRLRHILTVIVSIIFVATGIHAETVTQKEASRIASLFFNEMYGNVMSKPKYVFNGKQYTTDRLFSPFYVYNHPSGGFVIIAADNKAFPILAYSRTGAFNSANTDSETNSILSDYAADIELIRHDSRIPFEAMEAWSDIPAYIHSLIHNRYEISSSLSYPDSKGDYRLIEGSSMPGFVAIKSATEYPIARYLNLSDNEEGNEPEYIPFSFYDSFVKDTYEEIEKRDAMFEEILTPSRPVVNAIGGGHFQVLIPEPITKARVFTLQGALVELLLFKDTDTAVISLDREMPGFYIAEITGASGQVYGIKLYKSI